MRPKYQARWVSKPRVDALRRLGRLADATLVNHFRGYIIVEPTGSRLGDGAVLAADAADYELRTAWCQTNRAVLTRARRFLGLAPEPMERLAGVG